MARPRASGLIGANGTAFGAGVDLGATRQIGGGFWDVVKGAVPLYGTYLDSKEVRRWCEDGLIPG